MNPAAFGRLCVETAWVSYNNGEFNPAAFGRLCVETDKGASLEIVMNPAAFGRLCVETQIATPFVLVFVIQPPSGGCVLKQ